MSDAPPAMRWRKLAADARAYRAQWALIALVLWLAVAGMVAASDAQAVLQREIARSFAGAQAPDLVLWFDRIDDALVAGIARQPGVAAVSTRRVSFSRIAAAQGTDLTLHLSLVADPLALPVAAAHRHDGAPAAGDAGLWLEQSARGLVKLEAGRMLTVRSPAGTPVQLPLAGWLHDPGVAPSTQERLVYGWASPAVAARLAQNPAPDQLLVRLAARGSRGDAAERGHDLADAAKSLGRTALRVEVPTGQHPHAMLMTAMLRVLAALSVLAGAAGGAWAAVLVALWMRREQRIVGILKTLGAGRRQVALQYGVLALPLAALCAFTALPAGAAAARAFVGIQADALNIDLADLGVPPSLRALQIALAVGLPVLAVGIPVGRAVRMTPRRAIDGDGGPSGRGIGRWRARALALPGRLRWTLALRNSFRRPWRLSLQVLALGCGGALLLGSHSNYDSLLRAIDRVQAGQGHDVDVVLQRPAPAEALEAVARGVPGVAKVEAWRRSGVALAAVGDAPAAQDPPRLPLLAYPQGSALFRRAIVEGRAPAAGARDELLASRSLLAEHPGLAPGGHLTLQHGERSAVFRVVGLVEEIGPAMLYAPFEAHHALTGAGDAAQLLRVKAAPGTALDTLSQGLDQALMEAHHTPAQVLTRERVRESLDEHFKVVGDVVRTMALTVALLGAIGLAAGSAMNVLERTREIGVLRAMGATPRELFAMLLAEALAVLGFSLLLAVPAGLALAAAADRAAEATLLHVAVPLTVSPQGVATLAGGVLVVTLAVAASLRRVLRQSARDALAYE